MKIAIAQKNNLSISTRYTLMILSLSIICMLVLAFMLLLKQIQQNAQYIDKLGEMVAKQLSFTVDDMLIEDDAYAIDNLLKDYVNEYSILGVALYNTQKELIAKEGRLPQTPIDLQQRAYKQAQDKEGGLFNLGNRYIIHTHSINKGSRTLGTAVVIFSHKILYQDFYHQLILMVLITIVMLLIVTLGAIQIARRLTTPIRDLLSATEHIQQGKIDHIPERRNDEIGSLINAINGMSQGLIRKGELESLLGKFLTKDVADKVMDQLDPVHMSGEHVEATVVFADIVGFTSISEDISPEDIQELLNEYYHYFNACARFYYGTVDKYIGDCVMLVFGALKPDPKHQYHAVACAVLMQKLADHLNKKRESEGLFPIELRIGINSGKMLAGLIGSSERMEYTVVGDAVNLASRLCNEANSAQIIIEESLYHAINPDHPLDVEMFKSIRVRGKKDLVNIYSVKGVSQAYQIIMDDLISDILSEKA